MRIDERLVINLVDLDYILDIDVLESDRNKPPSELFLEMLRDELDMSGLGGGYLQEIDRIEIRLKYT